MDNTLESLLQYLDSVLGLDRIGPLYWLLGVAVFFFALTCLLPNFKSHKSSNDRYKSKPFLYLIVFLLVLISAGISIFAFISSYFSGHFYSIYIVLGLIAQLFCSFILACSWQYFGSGRKIERVKEFLTHFNAILIIFILSAKWLIRGLDAEETSADTLNIFFNGHFEYSMHAGWYDLAPVDSIIKVVLLNIIGDNNPYSPIETFMISFLSGLSLYFIVYSYMKDKRFLSSLIPLIPALLMIHPYAFLSGVYVTPTNVASALALTSIIVFLNSQKTISRSTLIVTKLLIITSILAHPFSIAASIFIGVTLLSKYMDKKTISSRNVWFLFSILTIWIAKMTYTAALYGVISVYNTVINGLFSIAEREKLLAVRNLGYLALPKLALASFSASLGIVCGISVRHLYAVSRSSNQRWYSFWIIIFAGVIGLLSLLGALGGYSRYLLVPFASLFFVPLMFHFEGKNSPSRYFLALIMISAILTSLTPNIIADQYSFPTVAKLSDKTMFTIARSIFEKLDPEFIVERFHGYSKMKLYFVQEGEFLRTYGSDGLIVEKIILSGIVKAKSYWDFVDRGPFDTFNGTLDYNGVNVVFDSGLAKVAAIWNHQ